MARLGSSRGARGWTEGSRRGAEGPVLEPGELLKHAQALVQGWDGASMSPVRGRGSPRPAWPPSLSQAAQPPHPRTRAASRPRATPARRERISLGD